MQEELRVNFKQTPSQGTIVGSVILKEGMFGKIMHNLIKTKKLGWGGSHFAGLQVKAGSPESERVCDTYSICKARQHGSQIGCACVCVIAAKDCVALLQYCVHIMFVFMCAHTHTLYCMMAASCR